MPRRESFTERRRRMLARQVAALDKLEPRNSIGDLSSPLGMAYHAMGAAALYQFFTAHDEALRRGVVGTTTKRPAAAAVQLPAMLPVTAAPPRSARRAALPLVTAQPAGDWLTLGASGRMLVSSPEEPRDAARPAFESPSAPNPQPGALSAGGKVNLDAPAPGFTRGTITPLRIPPPNAAGTDSSSTPAKPPNPNPPGTPPADESSGGISQSQEPAAHGEGEGVFTSLSAFSSDTPLISPPVADVDFGLIDVAGGDSGASMMSFTNFFLLTLDYNNGVVLFPNTAALATPGGDMDLRAQVRDTTVVSYDWDTSGCSTPSQSREKTLTGWNFSGIPSLQLREPTPSP